MKVVHYRLAELETEVELLRSLLYRTLGERERHITPSHPHHSCAHTSSQHLPSHLHTLILSNTLVHTLNNLHNTLYLHTLTPSHFTLTLTPSHPHTGLYLKGHDVTKLASMAKLKSGRLAREVSDSCLQYWGGMGYTSEVEISRLYRDVRLVSIGGGADEVMLSIICKLSGTLPKSK